MIDDNYDYTFECDIDIDLGNGEEHFVIEYEFDTDYHGVTRLFILKAINAAGVDISDPLNQSLMHTLIEEVQGWHDARYGDCC